MPATHIALVGHCGFDSGSLKRFAEELAPDAEVSRVNTQASLDETIGRAGSDALLLVNRVLDGSFETGGSGVDLIRALASRPDPPAMMLISNYDDAQQQAIEAGALPGFGKSQIGEPTTRQRLAEAIGQHPV